MSDSESIGLKWNEFTLFAIPSTFIGGSYFLYLVANSRVEPQRLVAVPNNEIRYQEEMI